jgi:hypothetical protein
MIGASHDGAIRWAWPAVANEVFAHEGYREDFAANAGMVIGSCLNARWYSRRDPKQVLSFALEMETLDVKFEEETPSEELKKETAAQIAQTFHQTIYGPVSNVGTAGTPFHKR